jgi:hypothetical protein
MVLIIPPSPFLGDEKRQPPLGILYVAAWLEKIGQKVQIVDLRTISASDWMERIPPSTNYGITATTPEYAGALTITRQLKHRDRNCSVLLGSTPRIGGNSRA